MMIGMIIGEISIVMMMWWNGIFGCDRFSVVSVFSIVVRMVEKKLMMVEFFVVCIYFVFC